MRVATIVRRCLIGRNRSGRMRENLFKVKRKDNADLLEVDL